MPAPPNIRVGGRSVPSGYVVGRSVAGQGPQQLIDIQALGALLAASGVVAIPGGPSSPTTIATNRVLGNGSGSTAAAVALSITQPAAGLTVSWAVGGITLALANDLAALETLPGTGIAVRTASDTWAQRSVVAPAAGITVSNNDGVSGNPTLVLANDLAALEAMSGTGLVARTASETYAQRTITGTASRITITNGGGVAGDPTIDIHTSYVGQASITTLGTITTGTWNGTAIAVANGGTGQTSYTDGQLLIGNSSGNTLTKASLSAGSGITITPGGGSITIAAAGGGGSGSWSLVSTQTASSSAFLAWTGLSTDLVYVLVLNRIVPATDGAGIDIQIGQGGSPTWMTTGYSSAAGFLNSTSGSNATSHSVGIVLTPLGISNTASKGGCNGQIWIHNLCATIWKQFHGTATTAFFTTPTISVGNTVIGNYNADTNAGTALRIILSTGNIASGAASLYSITP